MWKPPRYPARQANLKNLRRGKVWPNWEIRLAHLLVESCVPKPIICEILSRSHGFEIPQR